MFCLEIFRISVNEVIIPLKFSSFLPAHSNKLDTILFKRDFHYTTDLTHDNSHLSTYVHLTGRHKISTDPILTFTQTSQEKGSFINFLQTALLFVNFRSKTL